MNDINEFCGTCPNQNPDIQTTRSFAMKNPFRIRLHCNGILVKRGNDGCEV